jgi:hypothetical protein
MQPARTVDAGVMALRGACRCYPFELVVSAGPIWPLTGVGDGPGPDGPLWKMLVPPSSRRKVRRHPTRAVLHTRTVGTDACQTGHTGRSRGRPLSAGSVTGPASCFSTSPPSRITDGTGAEGCLIGGLSSEATHAVWTATERAAKRIDLSDGSRGRSDDAPDDRRLRAPLQGDHRSR